MRRPAQAVQPVGAIAFTLLLCLLGPLTGVSAYNNEEEASELSQYKADFSVSLPENDDLFLLEIAPEALATMDPSLRDLRLYAGGKELGYMDWRRVAQQPEVQELPLEVLNEGMTADGQWTFVAVMPQGGIPDGADLTVALGENQPYLYEGVLYGSSDNKEWTLLRDVTVYGLDDRSNRIPLEGIQYPYLKLELTTAVREQEMELRGAYLYVDSKPLFDFGETWERVDYTLTEKSDGARRTVVDIDLGTANARTGAWALQTPEERFQREVRIEVSPDGEQWSTIHTTFVFRGASLENVNLTADYGEAFARYVRATIFHGNNEPLPIQAIQMKKLPTRVVVKVPTGLPSELEGTAYWGNEEAPRPSYDIEGLLTESGGRITLAQAAMTGVLPNPTWIPLEDRLPLTEKHPYLLPAGMIIGLLLMGWVLYRNVKRIK